MTHTANDFTLTPAIANAWLTQAVENIGQEYPHLPWIVADSAADYVLHRESHPTFFGSLDWHSCVEMYWVAARIMRLFPGLPVEDSAVAIIDELLTPEHIARESTFIAEHPGFERPYGWGWLLQLQHELGRGMSPEARRWSETLRPLSQQIVNNFAQWLPKLTYAQRIGMHTNTAFALTMSWPEVSSNHPELSALFSDRARFWFLDDVHYPFGYEPSGADFLSAGLCEAVLMQRVLAPEEFDTWIERFLPTPGSHWLVPAIVSDESDGQLAHLHGLNLSRSWALGELAAVVPTRREELLKIRAAHIDASIGVVTGSHYMVSHWVAAYALLLATEPENA